MVYCLKYLTGEEILKRGKTLSSGEACVTYIVQEWNRIPEEKKYEVMRQVCDQYKNNILYFICKMREKDQNEKYLTMMIDVLLEKKLYRILNAVIERGWFGTKSKPKIKNYLESMTDVDILLQALFSYRRVKDFVDLKKIEEHILQYGTGKQLNEFVKLGIYGNLQSEKEQMDFVKIEHRLYQLEDPVSLVEFSELYDQANVLRITDTLITWRACDSLFRLGINPKADRTVIFDALLTLDPKKAFSFLEKYSMKISDAIPILIQHHYLKEEDVVHEIESTVGMEHDQFLKQLGSSLYYQYQKEDPFRVDYYVDQAVYFQPTLFDAHQYRRDRDQLWLVNLSLTRINVTPSAVKDLKEVKENPTFYLELLKKCDPSKYYYYIDAFDGIISFEEADQYYQYYLENRREQEFQDSQKRLYHQAYQRACK